MISELALNMLRLFLYFCLEFLHLLKFSSKLFRGRKMANMYLQGDSKFTSFLLGSYKSTLGEYQTSNKKDVFYIIYFIFYVIYF